jgi:hypothetical protein
VAGPAIVGSAFRILRLAASTAYDVAVFLLTKIFSQSQVAPPKNNPARTERDCFLQVVI